MTDDIEVAPLGTRKLLEDSAKALRERETFDRSVAERFVERARDSGDRPAQKREYEDGARGAVAKADGCARLAGRIEAHLAGWEQ